MGITHMQTIAYTSYSLQVSYMGLPLHDPVILRFVQGCQFFSLSLQCLLALVRTEEPIKDRGNLTLTLP